jgi:predicted DNA-binding transcriptional regulator AlpA
VPATARDHVTTEELLAVTRSSRDTLYEWVARRLLPRPRIATGADGQQFAAWAPETLERVRFIVANQRRGLPIEDIAPLVEARWPRR